MENDINTLVSIISFIIISLSCFKFFNFSNSTYDMEEKLNNEKTKHHELLKLKKEIEFITNKFNSNYTKAKRGELNKKDPLSYQSKKFKF